MIRSLSHISVAPFFTITSYPLDIWVQAFLNDTLLKMSLNLRKF